MAFLGLVFSVGGTFLLASGLVTGATGVTNRDGVSSTVTLAATPSQFWFMMGAWVVVALLGLSLAIGCFREFRARRHGRLPNKPLERTGCASRSAPFVRRPSRFSSKMKRTNHPAKNQCVKRFATIDPNNAEPDAGLWRCSTTCS
jgi:hypothetical protein